MKVLIADDEPISRRLLQNYLERWGYEVVVAENGRRAWQLFQEQEFPMVISDWLMPEMDGLELVRRIRGRAAPDYTYAVLVTVRAQKEDLVEAMEAGADDFISKPFDRDELRVRLREGERIIRLQQTLAEQNQRLAQAERELNGVAAASSAHSSGPLADSLREPLTRLQQAATQLDALLPNLAQIAESLRALQPSAGLGPTEGPTLVRLADDCAATRVAIQQQLQQWREQLQRLADALGASGDTP